MRGCSEVRAVVAALLWLAASALPAEAQRADPARPGAGPEVVTGRPEVIEPEVLSFPVGGRVRIVGVDAPDRGQTCISGFGKRYDCHEAAMRFTRGAVRDHDVTCRIVGLDVERQKVGVCFVGGQNIGASMVRAGWAFAWRTLGHDYTSLEAQAQTAMAGVWIGPTEAPWSYRARRIGLPN